MSDDLIILIPEKGGHVPSAEEQARTLSMFRELVPKVDEVVAEVTENIRFEDCGQNFGKIFCPDCGEEMKLETWQDRMSDDFDGSSFKLNAFKMPCCGASRTLHELRYEWPQGFGRFSLAARNPNVGKLATDFLASLSAAAGCQLRAIYRRE